MPEARDRLVRPVDFAALFLRRREQVLGILLDEPETSPSLSGSPMRRAPSTPMQRAHPTPMQRAQATALTRAPVGAISVVRRRGSNSRTGSGRGGNLYRTPAGRENTPVRGARRGRARATNSVLPSWYPRTPLRDVTAVVRAIERRRAALGELNGQQTGSPLPQGGTATDESVPPTGAELEHDMVTPILAPKMKQSPPSTAKVHKVLLDITKQNGGEEFLTPQKKLLNSIDKVEKVVMVELQKLKRTPAAKREEREKRVRTLMSMR